MENNEKINIESVENTQKDMTLQKLLDTAQKVGVKEKEVKDLIDKLKLENPGMTHEDVLQMANAQIESRVETRDLNNEDRDEI